MVPHVHGDFCHFLTHPTFGRFRQATLPRSFFKTWVATVGGAIWLTLPDEDKLFTDLYPYKGPNCRVLIASNVIDNAAKMVNKIKQEWMSNPRLQAAFPEIIPDFNKTRWSDHAAEVNRTLKATETTYTAVGVGGSVISQHFDHIIEDDLVYAKKDDFTGMELMPSQEDIDNAIGWHKLSFSLLANPKTGCGWNIGTRWAPQDLINYIRKFEHQYQCFEMDAEDGGDGQVVWPERYSIDILQQIKEAQGARIYECFAAGAPILMADFTYKNIEDIHIDDEVVGIEHGSGVDKAKLVKATVNLVEQQVKDTVILELEEGRIIKCTADHPWYTGRCDKTHKPYSPARVGGKLLQVDKYIPRGSMMWQTETDYRYLAGIIDGEGACNHGNIAIGQSKDANPDVYAGIEAVLQRLNIPYNISVCNPNDTHILRDKTIRRGFGVSFVLNGGRQLKADIIRYGKPAKSGRILKTIWNHPHQPIKGESKVVAMREGSREIVYAIGTTSGNYVAYGYATKNTQYRNRPRAMEDVVFDVRKLQIHDSRDEYPRGMTYFTAVDLAGWGDTKGSSRNAIVTAARDDKNHVWVARVDAGRFNPTQVIDLYKEHSRQFGSTIYIEEIQYQAAVSFWSREEMEKTGEFFTQRRLPRETFKDAKKMRIVALEPLISNGALHILASMKSLMEEVELYPHSKTLDILDCLGYLRKVLPIYKEEVAPPIRNPFSIDSIEEELRTRAHSSNDYPFDVQLSASWRSQYGRN